jgi:hypothetical protein
MRLDWQTSMGLAPSSSGSAFVAAGGAAVFGRDNVGLVVTGQCGRRDDDQYEADDT